MSEMDGKPLIFISHATDESASALVIENTLKHAFGDTIEVFNTSNRQSLQAGDPWRDKIITALKAADAVLVLCSPASIKNGWIHFEAGGAWAIGSRVVPCCIKGLKPANLPSPLRDLQAVDLSSAEDFATLLAHLVVIHPTLVTAHSELANIPRLIETAWEADVATSNAALVDFVSAATLLPGKYQDTSESGLLVIDSIYPTTKIPYSAGDTDGLRSGLSLSLTLKIVGGEKIFYCFTAPDLSGSVVQLGVKRELFGEVKCLGLMNHNENTTKNTLTALGQCAPPERASVRLIRDRVFLCRRTVDIANLRYNYGGRAPYISAKNCSNFLSHSLKSIFLISSPSIPIGPLNTSSYICTLPGCLPFFDDSIPLVNRARRSSSVLTNGPTFSMENVW
jgi:hypothetical protein